MRSYKLVTVLFLFSLFVNWFLFREVLCYEPTFSKNRFANRLKQKGLLDKKFSLSTAFGDSVMVILALGQSNAGNYVNHLYTPQGPVFNYYHRKLYAASDPLIGADGDGGSTWTVMADMVLKEHLYKKVIIISLASGGSTIDSWSHGTCRQKLLTTLTDMSRDNLIATHIFWQQGESDAGGDCQIYQNNLRTILHLIRSYHQPAPFFCAIASYSPTYIGNDTGITPNIVEAQKEFISSEPNVYYGANTDELICAIDRYDGQHFSEAGNRKCAERWLKAIVCKDE